MSTAEERTRRTIRSWRVFRCARTEFRPLIFEDWRWLTGERGTLRQARTYFRRVEDVAWFHFAASDWPPRECWKQARQEEWEETQKLFWGQVLL